ncbi:MAG: PIN domain-containing protein [Flavobacteriales bacterium]|nr:PIN domain-containing protein [Flavobacteriales bacterium]
MNRYFVDANVLLDALLERPDHSEDSIALLAMGAREEVRLLTTPISIGVLLYHLQRSDADKKGLRLQQAQRILADLLACVEVVPVETEHFQKSIASGFGDLEDGAQYWAAVSAGPLDAVVSRDPDYDGHIGVKRISAKQAVRRVKRKK